ncbi:MAG TPA: nitroreductase family protein [Candidatus Binataceae bacterium]|nr:nitroreductase family protein [Candidatus Binataceae bacterium]
MDFFEVATSTPTVRRFSPRPIAASDLERVLETANMAPSGSNAQPWEFVIVREQSARREIQQMYEAVWGPYKESAIIRRRKTLSPRAHKALGVGDEFAATLAIVPVHVVVFLDRPKMRVARGTPEDLFNFGATYGSIFPAIELLMLAARALGIGTAMTTMLSSREDETKALLGAPGDFQLIALVPMGYPDGDFKRPYRKPVWPRLHDGRFGRAWPRATSG